MAMDYGRSAHGMRQSVGLLPSWGGLDPKEVCLGLA